MSYEQPSLQEILKSPRLIDNIGALTHEWLITRQRCTPLGPEFQIGMAGWSRANLGFFFVRPAPTYGQILACFGGTGEVLVGEKWVRCTAGQAYLTPPHHLHAYRAIPDSIWQVAWIHDDSGLIDGVPRVVTAPSEDFHILLEGLYREVMGCKEIVTMEHWLRLIRVFAGRIAGSEQPQVRLHSLWSAVVADPGYDWSIGEMTRWVGVGEEHLRRLSVAETGRSPMRQVTMLRMLHAESLLSSGRYSITEVSARVGYDNPFAFSTAFKRMIGRSPSAYTLRLSE